MQSVVFPSARIQVYNGRGLHVSQARCQDQMRARENVLAFTLPLNLPIGAVARKSRRQMCLHVAVIQ